MRDFGDLFGDEYDLFKLVCPHYDELQETIARTVFVHYVNWIINHWKIKYRILEIGCGTGSTTKALLKEGLYADITIVDIEEDLVMRTIKRCSKQGVERELDFIVGDAFEVLRKIPNESYNAVASGFTLHNFNKEYRSEVLDQIERIVVPGGVLVIGDKIARGSDKDYEDLAWQLNAIVDAFYQINRPDLIKKWIDHYLEDDKPEFKMYEFDTEYAHRIGFKNATLIKRWHGDAIIEAEK